MRCAGLVLLAAVVLAGVQLGVSATSGFAPGAVVLLAGCAVGGNGSGGGETESGWEQMSRRCRASETISGAMHRHEWRVKYKKKFAFRGAEKHRTQGSQSKTCIAALEGCV